MHRSWVAKAAGAACLLVLAIAPGASAASPGKTTICHATGSAKNPYVKITVSNKALKAHRHHHDGRDIIPAPAGGCPKPAAAAKGDKAKAKDKSAKGHAKVRICHATGSETNPYVLITIAEPAVAAHKRHQDGRDLIPAPIGPDGKAYCPAPSSGTPAPANGAPGSSDDTQSTNGADNGNGTDNANANANGQKTPAAGTAPPTASGTAPGTASGTAPSTASGTAPTAGQGVKGERASHTARRTKRTKRGARHAVKAARAQAFTG